MRRLPVHTVAIPTKAPIDSIQRDAAELVAMSKEAGFDPRRMSPLAEHVAREWQAGRMSRTEAVDLLRRLSWFQK